MADAPKLTLADLLVFGRDWQHYLDQGPSTLGYNLPLPTLHQFVTAANAGLELLIKQDTRKSKGAGGRPRGSGMGDQVARLIANGMSEPNALRAVAREQRKSIDAVKDSFARVTGAAAAGKKPT